MPIGFLLHRQPTAAAEAIATALYRSLLGREPDRAGLEGKVALLQSGWTLDQLIENFMESPEFRARMIRTLVPRAELPDLTRMMPEKYQLPSKPGERPLYVPQSDHDITLMDSLIRKHRYYDRFSVWSPVIELDKEIIAAIVRGLGARSCFELGCFTGSVLSLLAQAGIDVVGMDVSHSAFAFAYPNIRDSIVFGDLLAVDIHRRFDVVLCMDVLEHISPLHLDEYIAKLGSILEDDGYIYLNSPMFGRDPVFGITAEPDLASWRAIGDASYWRHWPCDVMGWPEHGHLIWASANWWHNKFAAHGLERDVAIEQAIHRRLDTFFDQGAPGRRSLFVLRKPTARKSTAKVVVAVDAALASLPGLPRKAR